MIIFDKTWMIGEVKNVFINWEIKELGEQAKFQILSQFSSNLRLIFQFIRKNAPLFWFRICYFNEMEIEFGYDG